MSLNPVERAPLEDACRITNSIPAGEHSKLHTALALATFATIIAGDSPVAKTALALQMAKFAFELDADAVIFERWQ